MTKAVTGIASYLVGGVETLVGSAIPRGGGGSGGITAHKHNAQTGEGGPEGHDLLDK